MGAGFVSGRELVSFFGTGGFIFYLNFASILLSACFLVLFLCGRNFKGLNQLNETICTRPKLLQYAVLTASFISVSSMISGIDSLIKIAFNFNLPIGSVTLLVLVSVFSYKGVKGVERLSVILMPIVIISATFMILKKGDVTYVGGESLGVLGLILALLYPTMNTFINLPVLVDCAYHKSKKVLCICAVLSGVILCVEGYLILNTVIANGTTNSDVPLLSALKGGGFILFFACLFSSVVTSVFSAYYPLYFFSKERGGSLGVILLALSVYCFSRLGLKNIISYVYPILGVFGAVYLFYCVKFLFRLKKLNKNANRENNKRYRRNL